MNLFSLILYFHHFWSPVAYLLQQATNTQMIDRQITISSSKYVTKPDTEQITTQIMQHKLMLNYDLKVYQYIYYIFNYISQYI